MRLYNTLTKRKEDFHPLEPPLVRMYVCGPTVYDSPHVGHARSAVAFDLLRRYLEYNGYDVIFVRNYTDIDDKMINRARALGTTIGELARKYIFEYESAMNLLNVKPPVYSPRATHLIGDFIRFIKVLVNKGCAYERNGAVYFRVASFKDYGKLSLKPQKEIADVLRRDSEEFINEKEDPRDFALWKRQKHGEPAWNSPWGPGRPGWHVECSVMSMKFLGETIDIHGGGRDLIFPHHENEIAQSESYSGKLFCRFWIHNGFVTVDKEKMSKSLGNFFTVDDVLKEYDAQALRLFLISAQYRNPINFSAGQLEQARKNWQRIKETWVALNDKIGLLKMGINGNYASSEEIKSLIDDFESAMDDDLNTPKALSVLFRVVKKINEALQDESNTEKIKQLAIAFQKMLEILGFDDRYILQGSAREDKRGRGGLIEKLVDYIIEIRKSARKEKKYSVADNIREFLRGIGIELHDLGEDTTWKFIDI
ncbi:MAG: cysteine--tRNA ligase [Promethearchaeota archaeon]